MYKNMGDAAKAVLKGKFIALNAYIWNETRSQINYLSFNLKKIEMEEQSKPKQDKEGNKEHKSMAMKIGVTIK